MPTVISTAGSDSVPGQASSTKASAALLTRKPSLLPAPAGTPKARPQQAPAAVPQPLSAANDSATPVAQSPLVTAAESPAARSADAAEGPDPIAVPFTTGAQLSRGNPCDTTSSPSLVASSAEGETPARLLHPSPVCSGETSSPDAAEAAADAPRPQPPATRSGSPAAAETPPAEAPAARAAAAKDTATCFKQSAGATPHVQTVLSRGPSNLLSPRLSTPEGSAGQSEGLFVDAAADEDAEGNCTPQAATAVAPAEAAITVSTGTAAQEEVQIRQEGTADEAAPAPLLTEPEQDVPVARESEVVAATRRGSAEAPEPQAADAGVGMVDAALVAAAPLPDLLVGTQAAAEPEQQNIAAARDIGNAAPEAPAPLQDAPTGVHASAEPALTEAPEEQSPAAAQEASVHLQDLAVPTQPAVKEEPFTEVPVATEDASSPKQDALRAAAAIRARQTDAAQAPAEAAAQPAFTVVPEQRKPVETQYAHSLGRSGVPAAAAAKAQQQHAAQAHAQAAAGPALTAAPAQLMPTGTHDALPADAAERLQRPHVTQAQALFSAATSSALVPSEAVTAVLAAASAEPVAASAKGTPSAAQLAPAAAQADAAHEAVLTPKAAETAATPAPEAALADTAAPAATAAVAEQSAAILEGAEKAQDASAQEADATHQGATPGRQATTAQVESRSAPSLLTVSVVEPAAKPPEEQVCIILICTPFIIARTSCPVLTFGVVIYVMYICIEYYADSAHVGLHLCSAFNTCYVVELFRAN